MAAANVTLELKIAGNGLSLGTALADLAKASSRLLSAVAEFGAESGHVDQKLWDDLDTATTKAKATLDAVKIETKTGET